MIEESLACLTVAKISNSLTVLYIAVAEESYCTLHHHGIELQ